MRLDLTLDAVGNSRFITQYSDLIKDLLRQTRLKETEIRTLLMIFYKHALHNDPKAKYMTKDQVIHFFEIYFRIFDLKIIERILMIITGIDSIVRVIHAEDWIRLYLIYTSENLSEKINFCFRIYDQFDYKSITRDSVARAFSAFLVEEDDESEELLTEMVELVMKRFDIDMDGKISYEDYYETVKKEPLLLEFLGTCFPAQNIVDIFNSHLFRKEEE